MVFLCTIAFGVVPLRQLLKRTRNGGAPSSGRHTDAATVWRLRTWLVAANVAMAVLLLVGSGLLVRSLTTLLAVSPGFDPSGVVTMQIWAAGSAFRDGEVEQQVGTAVRFYEDILSRARVLPGVTAAAAVSTLPLGGGVDGYGFHVRGRPLANPEEAPTADRFVVTHGFFGALRIPLLRGRLLDERDRLGADPVVVINRTAAAELFHDEDPIGHQVSLGPPTAQPRTIVGVVGDVRHHGLHRPVGYQVYVPQAQWAWAETFMTLVIKSSGEAAAVARPVREIVREIDAAQPVTDLRLYEEIVAASTGTRRFAATLLTLFAGTAVVLALVGLYGALGFTVEQRRREIGVRLALGARPNTIGRMVVGQGIRSVAPGLAAGLGLAALSTAPLQSLLYEVDARDPLTFATAAGVVAVSAACACLLPAWRAAHIDPASTLRD